MRKNVLLLLGFMVMGFALFSGTKTPRPASVSQVHNGIQRCVTKMPGEEWENAFQQQIQQFQAAHSNPASRISVAYTIPVIVHVVYYTSAQNIPQSQVQSQINTLNADYAGTGLNVGNCPAVFQSLVANTNITFCLAAKDPNGVTLSEPGIDRVNAVTKGFTNPGTSGWTDTYIDANIKPNTIWDPTKYLNIWVLPISGGILGYATFPAGTGLSGLSGFGTATDDGVVINYTNFGTVGTGAYSKGRTASHEIGHWLGLRHISGDSNCGNDYCGDTPVQSGNAGDGQGLNYGCPTYPSVTCSNGPNGDMFMNFMDYTDDACMYMFTPNQTTRMQTALANGTYRKFFSASTCNAGPSAPVANFTSNKTTVCVGGTVAFTDNSSNTPTSWSWTFAGGTPATSTLQNPTVTYNSAGTYTVTLTATNSLGSNTITQTNYITVINSTGAALPLTEGFQSTTFPPTGWTLATHSGFNWERTTVAGGFGSSTASALFNNYDNDATGLADDMISPSLSISNVTNPKVKFDYAYAYYSGTQGTAYDTLQVLIWDVCANTYTSIFKKGGTALATAPATSSSFVPTATQWKSDSVAIPTTFLNKNVKVVFRNISDYGQNLYVDNINIYGTTASSIAASFTSSADSVCQGGSLTFTSTSTGGPFDSIRWIFPNGTPATSTATNPSVTFNTAATITVTLKVYKSGNSSTSTKTIVVKAKPTVVANGMAICNGNTASITATGATTYSWNTGATGATLSVSPTTTTTYTVTGTTSGCTNTDTAIVTVNAKPTVIANGSTICAGNSATITASGAGTYTWNTGATGATLTVSPTVTTTYTVTGTGTNGCTNTDTAIISVNAKPTVIANGAGICSGSSATLTASGASTYSWNTGATGATITVTPTTTTIYTVTGTSTNGCTNTDTAIVNVSARPTVVANGSAICAGSSATITASGASTYTWNTGASGATLTVSPTTTTTYTVTGSTNGCTNTDTAIISIKALPTVVANGSAICAGNSASITASGAGTYTWNTGATGATLTVSPTVTTTYTVTGTGTNGCTNTDTAIISVNAKPSVIANGAGICSGSSATLTASGASTYSWNTGATGATITVTPTTTTIYTVTGTSTNGCTNTDTAIVNVSARPTVVANGSAICAGSSATITASGASTYTWNTGASGATLTVSPTTTTTYTVTGSTNGCTNTDTAIISIKALPTVVANGSAVCAGSSATITASGAGTYTWNTGATGATLTVSPTVTTTYTVTGTGTNGCTNTDTAIISVNALPNVSVSSITICSGQTGTLTATGATAYSWNTGATTASISVSPTTTTTYTVTGTANGCTKNATATVSVATAPNVVLNTNNVAICLGDSYTFTASGASTYTWSNGATGSQSTITPTQSGTISVTGTLNGCPSTSTANASFTVNPKPTVAVDKPTAAICSGSSVTINASGATSYTWNTGATGAAISVSPTTTTTYTVTGTSNNCSNTAISIITVNPIPNTTITPSTTSICSGQPVTLNGGGATTYSWNTGATTQAITVSPTMTTIYTLTGTSNNCNKSVTQSITVNTTPTQAIITQNTGSDTLYSSTVVSGASYNWYLNGSSTPLVTNTPWIKITQGGSYTVQVISNGCNSPMSAQFAAIYTAIQVNSHAISLWEVYPNPTDGRLTFNLNLIKQSDVSMQIYNAIGSEVYSRVYGVVKDIRDEMHLDNLASGVYIIQMHVDNEIFYHKVMKK